MNWPPSWRRMDSRWDRVGDDRIHVRFAGGRATDRSVVLVHGLGVSSRYLAPTALALQRRGVYVEAPDLPGYGRSPASTALDLAGLADALGRWLAHAHADRKPVLLANSFGCQVVASAARDAAHRISGLVLVGPTVDRRARSGRALAARWVRNAPREPLGLAGILAVDYAQCGVRRPRVALRSSLHDAIEETLADVAVPVLLVRGEDDPIAPRRWLDELAAVTPRSRVIELSGAAHTANFTAPDRLAEVTLDLLREVT